MLGRVPVQRRLVDEHVVNASRRRRHRRRIVFQCRRCKLVLRLLPAARLPRPDGLDDLHAGENVSLALLEPSLRNVFPYNES